MASLYAMVKGSTPRSRRLIVETRRRHRIDQPRPMPDDQTPPSPITIPIEPELDLHAFNPRDIPSVVEDYVHAAQSAGLREIRLRDGRGRGVQRGIVQAALERHPLVVEFWDDPQSHLGATIARLADAEPPGEHGD